MTNTLLQCKYFSYFKKIARHLTKPGNKQGTTTDISTFNYIKKNKTDNYRPIIYNIETVMNNY